MMISLYIDLKIEEYQFILTILVSFVFSFIHSYKTIRQLFDPYLSNNIYDVVKPVV